MNPYDPNVTPEELDAVAKAFSEAIDRLSPDERLALRDDLFGRYCSSCGRSAAEGGGPDCQCDNDE